METMTTDGVKCTLFLLLCSLSLSLSQDVRMPPSLVTGAKTLIIFKEVSKMTLHCVGVGNPAPTYEWTKNGEPLNNNPDNIYQTPGEGTIVIFPCRAADEGYYQCTLTNSFGKTMSNMTFLQMATLQPFPPSNGIATYHISLYGYVCLRCARPASIPASNIYWTYNSTAYSGQPMLVNQTTRIQMDPFEGKLCIMFVQSSDGEGSTKKMYICNVENTFLSTIESGSVSKITITTVISPSYDPFLTFGSPASLIGLEGEPLVLRCFFSGDSVPTVTWRKNGLTPPQSDWTVTNEGTGLTLNSGRLTRGDGGQFTCTGSNGGGSANHTIQLTINARPVFLSTNLQPHDINVTEGDTVTIKCEPYAVPNVSIVWFKNGINFNESSLPPKFSLSADNKTLTITNVCKTCNEGGSGDLASIQCNASNEHGYGFAQGYVNVLVATVITSVGGIHEWIPYTNEVFECDMTSDDSTPMGRTWYYNDIIVQQSATVILTANGALVLLMQNEEDGGESRLGEYRCVASNGFSQAETIYILGVGNVRLPPSLVTGPTTLIQYEETTNVTLHCVGVGSPTPAYEWTKNGQPLNLNADNIHTTPGVGTIVIYPCRAADEGYYQCKLSNTFGRTMSNMTFLQMAILQSFPPSNGPANYTVRQNLWLCLTCAKPASIPAAYIYWTYDFAGHTGQSILVNQTTSIQTDPFTGDLCLTYVQETDASGSNNKTYICNAQNTFLSRIESGSHSMITLSTPDGGYPAFLTFAHPSWLIGLEGDPLVLRCFFSGSYIPWITWKKNGQTPPEDRWIVSNEGTGLTLISGKLTAEDAGAFTCKGMNGVGPYSHTHTIQLNVYARPVFLSNDLQPHDMNVTEGDTVTIKCETYAVPNASITWFKDAITFNASSLPPKFSLSADNKTLTITNVCKTCNVGGSGDLANIQFNASNEQGYAFAQGYVNVLVATVITSVGGIREWIPYTNEVFECQATSDDSTPVGRTWYYNDIIVQQSATVILAANGSLILLMQNEADGGESRLGEYRCVASNGYSEAEIIYILEVGTGTGTTTRASTSTTGISTTAPVQQNCGNSYFYGPSGVISSPGYPGNYSNYQACNYYVDPSWPTSSIALIFKAFDTQECCDYVTISCPDIPLYPSLRYSGPFLPQPFSIPRCNMARINLTTDDSVISTGFSLDYYVSLGDCGDTVYTESHDYISSPNYPNSHGNNQNCSIIIWTRLRSSFTITFLDMDLEECCDFVELSCLDNAEYGSHRFSGSSIPPKQDIPGCTQVLVWFHSDDSFMRPGFNLEYLVTPDPSE